LSANARDLLAENELNPVEIRRWFWRIGGVAPRLTVMHDRSRDRDTSHGIVCLCEHQLARDLLLHSVPLFKLSDAFSLVPLNHILTCLNLEP
jgi:hypothetical protein